MQDGRASGLPVTKDGRIDYSQDFFSRPAFLTVSGQLNVETYCAGLSDVYTFGPTFRAENSHTTRHLAEFWMIEPEIAFGTLADDMNLAEDYLKYCVRWALDHCADDLAFFDKQVCVAPGLVGSLGVDERTNVQPRAHSILLFLFGGSVAVFPNLILISPGANCLYFCGLG